MAERRIGIRELKSKLSECVREVRSGGTIVDRSKHRPDAFETDLHEDRDESSGTARLIAPLECGCSDAKSFLDGLDRPRRESPSIGPAGHPPPNKSLRLPQVGDDGRCVSP